mmetsp:Transcript_3439/g.4000  ORF Transcript_3439/g.4000 Transcript_3439/m.4000 type:complete len:358 (-) Transcript_3439:42-1115(-)
MSHETAIRATITGVPSSIPSQPTTRLVGHEGPVKVVRFSSCGKYCITGGHDRTVRLWNPARIDPVGSAIARNEIHSSSSSDTSLNNIPPALPIQVYADGHTHGIADVCIDDTSTTVLSASDKTLVVTDVISRKLKRRFQGHTGRINTVTCASSGNLFLSGSYDGTVRIWDGKSGNSNPIQTLTDALDSVSCVKVVQDANDTTTEIITTSIDGCVRVYDVRKGLLHVHDLGKDVALTCISQTSDNMCNAVSCLNGAVYVMEHTGCLLNTNFGGHTAGRYSLECCITADDQYIACGSENGAAVLYDFESGKVVQTLRGHSRATCSIACHPDRMYSSVVITASYDGNAIVWTNGTNNYLK